MKITIDTSHDSHEDIRKVIKMLKEMVGEVRVNYETSEPSQEPLPAPGLFSMFDSGPAVKEPETQEQSPDMLNMFESVSETPSKDPKSTEGMFKLFDTQTLEPKPEESSEEPSYQKLHLDEDSKDDDEYSFDLQTY